MPDQVDSADDRSSGTPTVGIDAASYDDYAAFTTLEGDALVLYRRPDDRAWLQSDDFVALADAR